MKVNIGPYPNNDNEERVFEVEIHDYDVWNMDHTLAAIILPMLVRLRDNLHSYPNEFSEPDWQQEDDGTRINYGGTGGGIDAWREVLNKIIVAFELQNNIDWPTFRDKDLKIVKEGTLLFGEFYMSFWD